MIVNGCEFMEDKPQILLEKGLTTAVVTGNLFRGERAIVDHSGVPVQIGLNATQ